MTDSLSSYPVNNTSSFVISWTTAEPSNSVHWATFNLSFAYQVNSDTLTDYGSIEFSPDNGTTWINLLNDPVYATYLNWDQSDANGPVPPVLSGNSNGWSQCSIDLTNLGSYLAIPAGTTVLWRFSFTSDGNQTNKEGLMFDDIFVQVAPPLSVVEGNSGSSSISPNPASYLITASFSGKQQRIDFVVFASDGQIVKRFLQQPSETTLDIRELEPGVYFLNACDVNGNCLASSKFVKL